MTYGDVAMYYPTKTVCDTWAVVSNPCRVTEMYQYNVYLSNQSAEPNQDCVDVTNSILHLVSTK